MKTLLILLAFSLVAMPGCLAQEDSAGTDQSLNDAQLDLVRNIYNNNIGAVPQVRDMLANERINFYIEDAGVAGIVNKDGKMESIQIGELPDPTMNMYTDMETLQDIIFGKLNVLDALKEGKITYEGVGFFNWVRFGFANFVFGVLVALGMA